MEVIQIVLTLIILLVVLVCMSVAKTRHHCHEMMSTTGGEEKNNNQLRPSHVIVLNKNDISEKVNPPEDLLCNWRDCKMGPNGGIAKALRLCPFCHRVGYCCVYCMEQDIYGHVSHNCDQNVKKATVQKV
jgi:hypothetical protein